MTFLCGQGDQFLVIESNAQLSGQLFSCLMAALPYSRDMVITQGKCSVPFAEGTSCVVSLESHWRMKASRGMIRRTKGPVMSAAMIVPSRTPSIRPDKLHEQRRATHTRVTSKQILMVPKSFLGVKSQTGSCTLR